MEDDTSIRNPYIRICDFSWKISLEFLTTRLFDFNRRDIARPIYISVSRSPSSVIKDGRRVRDR